MKLGDYVGRKVIEPNFREKFLIWRYSRKGLQISPKSDTDIFLKNGSNDFFGFYPKLVPNMTFNLNETCFLEKIVISRYLFGREIVKNLPKLRFLAIFSTLLY